MPPPKSYGDSAARDKGVVEHRVSETNEATATFALQHLHFF